MIQVLNAILCLNCGIAHANNGMLVTRSGPPSFKMQLGRFLHSTWTETPFLLHTNPQLASQVPQQASTMQQAHTAAVLLAVFALGCLTAVDARATQMGELRILAIGDSITQGSVPSKGANHPYTTKLQQLLQSKYSGMNVVVDNQGA